MILAGICIGKQKNNVFCYFDFVTNEENLKSQKICIAQHYSGDAMQFSDQNPDLNLIYIIPKEGVAMWIDNFAIPKEAKHKKNGFRNTLDCQSGYQA